MRGALLRMLTAAIGTNLPIRNVRFHGESWRVSGRATEIAKATRSGLSSAVAPQQLFAAEPVGLLR
jgi:hypothetical protein